MKSDDLLGDLRGVADIAEVRFPTQADLMRQAAAEIERLRAVLGEWKRHGTMCNFGLLPCGNCLGCSREKEARKAADAAGGE